MTTRAPLRRPGAAAARRDVSAADLAELLGHAARRLRRGSVAELAPLGLTMAQARVLRVLAAGPHRMADIAAALDVVPRTVTPMVDGLEGAGLAERRPDPDDRRSVLVALTHAGRRLLHDLDAARRHSAEDVFGTLSADERLALHGLLHTVCEAGGCHSCRAQQGER